MATYSTPGVYIQEVSTLPTSVAQVETAIPAFIGLTQKTVSEPKRISSMVEFIEEFGGSTPDMITVDVNGSGGSDTVQAASASAVAKKKNLYYHMLMYFSNGGGPCYVISAGNTSGTITELKIEKALGLLALEDEPTLIVIPEAIHNSTDDFYTSMQKALAQCNKLQDRFVIMDLKDDSGNFISDASDFRTNIGGQNLKYGAAYYPKLNTTLVLDDASVKVTYTSGQDATITSAFAALKLALAQTSLSLKDIIVASEDTTDPDFDTVGKHLTKFLSEQLGALRREIEQYAIVLGPSSSMAGAYVAVDQERGVWKAPANISLNAVSDVTHKINDKDQEDLNVSATGKSINAIRSFNGRGTLVWGARTLAGNDAEWRYIPVRRLFITMEESIKKATEFVVFEPNDKNTWERTRGMIENYLTVLWRQGALAGAKPEDAFFVNVGLGETMSAQDILEGKLIVEIGAAAVRPAEFIILRFSHKLQES